MHDDLHWLTVPQRLQYKLVVRVHRCLQHRAPRHLTDYLMPCLNFPVISIYDLPDVNCLFDVFAVLFCRRTKQFWKPVVDSEHFRRHLKAHLFTGYYGASVH